MEGIRKVVSYSTQPDWGDSPMRTRRKTGEIFYNEEYLKRPDLKPNHWFLFREHERGHVLLDTTDELAADEFARRQYFPSKRGLRDSVEAMLKVLDIGNPIHRQRIMVHLQEAERFDCEVNGNKKTCNTEQHELNLNMTPKSSIDQSILGLLDSTQVEFDRSVSVMDAFVGTECKEPKFQDCSRIKGIRFVARRNCKDQNVELQKSHERCIEGARKRESEDQKIRQQSEQLKTESANQIEILKHQIDAEKLSETEETKRTLQSKTPMIMAIVAIVLGTALMMFFLFRPKKATA